MLNGEDVPVPEKDVPVREMDADEDTGTGTEAVSGTAAEQVRPASSA
ncbi:MULTISPECIES: hypothetical protein [unclassified Streptomyces]